MAAAVTGDRYLDLLVRFVARNAGPLLDGAVTLRLHPVGLHYVAARLEALRELEAVGAGAPVDYLRAYVADLGDHRALEQLRRILRLLTSLKVVSALPAPARDPAPLSLEPFARLRVLELRGCDLSTSAARGLLALRHTLEQLICHNSTDALRHVFASRIMDIKDSPVWGRLSYVSCACNGLVLMDESLQLLPAVETLDLSRNRFAKVDNLRKCTKLRHLDLGFNQLRSIASLSEVSSRIAKLVVRNNALTTLHGIENLKSLMGLDLSYNIISNFSELEILGSLPLLQNLWLEGNPICCARWYRAHVFSFVPYSEKFRLDDKGINTQEYWERQVIFASKQKEPAGYGFYFPAKDDPEDEGSLSSRRKKNSRLACILEERTNLCEEGIEGEATSHDSDGFRKDENAAASNDVATLINTAELMKKERSIDWLREFKEWMDENYENIEGDSLFVDSNFTDGNGRYKKQKKRQKSFGMSSKKAADLVQSSEGGSSLNLLESDLALTDDAETAVNGVFTESSNEMNADQFHLRMHFSPLQNLPPWELVGSSHSDSFAVGGGDATNLKSNGTAPNAVKLMESGPSFVYPSPRSPPQYKEDILHRRLNLEEEFLQMSGDVHCFGSLDSGSSCSDDSSGELCSFSSEDDCLLAIQMKSKLAINMKIASFPYGDSNHDEKLEKEYLTGEKSLSGCFPIADPGCMDPKEFAINEPLYDGDHQPDQVVQDLDYLVRQKGKQKLNRRIIPLFKSRNGAKVEFLKANGEEAVENGCSEYLLSKNTFCCEEQGSKNNNSSIVRMDSSPNISNTISLDIDQHKFIKDFFNLKVANNEESETCEKVACCECQFRDGSNLEQRKVALLRSCKSKLYVLPIDVAPDGQETVTRVLGSYRLEDVEKVLIGLGLQALRIYIVGNSTYLFLTRTSEEAIDILCLLNTYIFPQLTSGFSLQSWEQVQVKLLEKHVCGSLKTGIFFYTLFMFWKNDGEEESWATRSLFVIEESILVCIENLDQFGSLIDDSDPPYFSLDSCCSIKDILELVVDDRDNKCLTLILDNRLHDDRFFGTARNIQNEQTGETTTVQTWKLNWFSEETLLKFISLLKAFYSGLAASPLPVKCIS